MTPAAPGRRPRWPGRVRTRLTLIYALLFLVSGSMLLGLTYGLVAASLQGKSPRSTKSPLTQAQYDKLCRGPMPAPAKPGHPIPANPKDPGAKIPGTKPVPAPVDAKTKQLCESALQAGFNAGATSQRDQALHSLLLYSLAGLAVMTLLSGGAGWLVAGRVLRPVRAITETARRASAENLGERIALAGTKDELKELADTFDEMLERLDRAFAAQRRFVADASHELRTPLTAMRTAIDVTLAKPHRTADQLDAMARRVRGSIERAEAMINALLTMAVSDQPLPEGGEAVDLATAAEDALDLAAGEIGQRSLSVRARLDPAPTSGDRALIDRMVANLIENAVRHNVDRGWIEVSTGSQSGLAYLRVSNSGPVIRPEDVAGLFEPFRRASARTSTGEGFGLGLAVARSVAAAHGARLDARSRPEGGLSVQVLLPARPGPG